MAGCDNLYGNSKEWKELYDFLVGKKRKKWVKAYMKPQPQGDEKVRICYIANIQGWLIRNCTLEWVQTRLNDNFDIQRMLLGKAHHEKGAASHEGVL